MSTIDEAITANESTPLPVSVKGVLLQSVNRTTTVLLLRNDRDEWELPGGRTEAGETPEESLARELDEETGLTVRVGPCIQRGVLTILPPHVLKTTHVSIWTYGCHLENPAAARATIVLSDEHKAAGWIPVDALAVMSDVPEIYKAAVLSWKKELDRPS
jgi:8-oxo-dGTP pyrophosphatase MutT (NUDIX family)